MTDEEREAVERVKGDLAETCPPGSKHTYALVSKADLRTLLASLAEKDARIGELERLRKVIERDRTRVADGLNAITKAIGSRAWMREPTRGSYAWDDERYQQEFGQALDEIDAALADFRILAADWSDCPTSPLEIAEARAALQQDQGHER